MIEIKSFVPQTTLRSHIPPMLRARTFNLVLQMMYLPYSQRMIDYLQGCRSRKYVLEHTSSVGSLTAVLNSRFQSALYSDGAPMTIWLTDNTPAGDWLQVPHIIAEEHVIVPDAEYLSGCYDVDDGPMVCDREKIESPVTSFTVHVPSDLYQTKLPQIRVLVDKYRLASRTAEYKEEV